MVWWGARKGRRPTRPSSRVRMPATEWILVVSMASSKDMGGRMVGMRRASMVLPEPGGPIIRTLCPPAQATSSARLAWVCPRTSAKSTRYSLAPARIFCQSSSVGAGSE